MSFTKIVFASLVLVVAASFASAADLPGQFVYQGLQTGVDGSGVEFSFDLYSFEVTNPNSTPIDVIGLDVDNNIQFNGSLLQSGGQNASSTAGLESDPLAGVFGLPADALQDDSFFVLPDGSRIMMNVTDSSTELSADTINTAGEILIPANGSSVIAMLSVETGTMPTLNAPAPAIYGSDMIGNIVPEPASMTLLGIGGLALLRRRRNRK